MKEQPIVVYWAPKSVPGYSSVGNWNMLYQEPEILFNDLIKNKEPLSKDMSFFSCPAVSTRLKQSYVFKNNLHSVCHFQGTNPGNTSAQTEEYSIGVNLVRPTALKNGMSLQFQLEYLFFCEEPLTAMFNPPMFHKPRYTNVGTIIPGGFDIGKWFRPFSLEIQTWEPEGTLVLEEDEPLFYVEFLTERKVILKRFALNERLWEYALSCAQVAQVYGKKKTLNERYHRFLSTKTNQAILKEIKENII